MENDPHPYVTIQPTLDGHYVAVLIDSTPEGIVQVSDKGEEHEDYIEAKRQGVEMAARADVPFLVPIHG